MKLFQITAQRFILTQICAKKMLMNRNGTIETYNSGSWSNMNGNLQSKEKYVKERKKIIDYSICKNSSVRRW